MSVLIKGMEMPKNCCECSLLSGFECRALFKDITDFSVADECPLVPVPPHGRLIDADALKEKAFFHEIDNVSYVEEEDIDKAPTVDSVERKKGKWIFEPKDAIELMFTKPKCSKCGYESADGGNFCSNCGAEMRGEANDTR